MIRRTQLTLAKELREPYTSKIIKAGALIADTKTLLSNWDLSASVSENLDVARLNNFFGKSSRSRVADMLAIFRQRYLTEGAVTQALVTLVQGKFPARALDKLLYFHSALSDSLLRDAVTEILLPRYSQGLMDINPTDFKRTLATLVSEGRTAAKWSDSTLTRISQGMLSALRDFGVLEGAVNKRIAAAYLPVEAFAYMAFYIRQSQLSGVKLVEAPEWRLFFLQREGVERFLFEAHQRALLEYHVAGSVARLTFPVRTLEEYAYVLAQR